MSDDQTQVQLDPKKWAELNAADPPIPDSPAAAIDPSDPPPAGVQTDAPAPMGYDETLAANHEAAVAAQAEEPTPEPEPTPPPTIEDHVGGIAEEISRGFDHLAATLPQASGLAAIANRIRQAIGRMMPAPTAPAEPEQEPTPDHS